MAGFENGKVSKEVIRKMSNAQFNAFLETLALLIETKAKTIEEAVAIVRNTKTTA